MGMGMSPMSADEYQRKVMQQMMEQKYSQMLHNQLGLAQQRNTPLTPREPELPKPKKPNRKLLLLTGE